jgi:hypothetical protein
MLNPKIEELEWFKTKTFILSNNNQGKRMVRDSTLKKVNCSINKRMLPLHIGHHHVQILGTKSAPDCLLVQV